MVGMDGWDLIMLLLILFFLICFFVYGFLHIKYLNKIDQANIQKTIHDPNFRMFNDGTCQSENYRYKTSK